MGKRIGRNSRRYIQGVVKMELYDTEKMWEIVRSWGEWNIRYITSECEKYIKDYYPNQILKVEK